MTYNEWIQLSAEDMMNVGPNKIAEILKDLPWGQKELDEEKAQKLGSVHTLSVTTGILCSLTGDKESAQMSYNIGSQIFSLIPDDTHTQTFLIGQITLKEILNDYFTKS